MAFRAAWHSNSARCSPFAGAWFRTPSSPSPCWDRTSRHGAAAARPFPSWNLSPPPSCRRGSKATSPPMPSRSTATPTPPRPRRFSLKCPPPRSSPPRRPSRQRSSFRMSSTTRHRGSPISPFTPSRTSRRRVPSSPRARCPCRTRPSRRLSPSGPYPRRSC